MESIESNENVVTCKNVGIRFSKTTPIPTLAEWLKSKFSNNDSSFFWALRDISFTIQKGELDNINEISLKIRIPGTYILWFTGTPNLSTHQKIIVLGH